MGCHQWTARAALFNSRNLPAGMAAARRPQFGYSFAQGPVAELVDAPDLKSVACESGVTVRVGPGPPAFAQSKKRLRGEQRSRICRRRDQWPALGVDMVLDEPLIDEPLIELALEPAGVFMACVVLCFLDAGFALI